MGTWNTGIFDNDEASDVRVGFRELIGSGLDADQATHRLIDAYSEWFVDAPETTNAWLALALAQWKVGRLLDWVRDRAIRVIDEGADLQTWEDSEGIEKRRQVLSKTRAILLSEQRAPVRIRAEPKPMSPFLPGDILRYRSSSGREVAFWAMWNDTHEGLTSPSVDTNFQLAMMGDLELPPVEEIVSGGPYVFTLEGGYRTTIQTTLWLPQQATGPGWDVIANVPFPDERRDRSHQITVVREPRSKRRAAFWIDNKVQGWWQASQRPLDATMAATKLRHPWKPTAEWLAVLAYREFAVMRAVSEYQFWGPDAPHTPEKTALELGITRMAFAEIEEAAKHKLWAGMGWDETDRPR